MGDRPVVLVAPMARATKHYAAQLKAAGIDDILVLACGAGGDPPDPLELSWHLLPVDHRPGAPDHDRFERLPPRLVDVVGRFDPHGRALVVTNEGAEHRHVEGRAVWGRVPDELRDLERKGGADPWFARAGYPTRSAVCGLGDPQLDRPGWLDDGEGVVWAGVDRSWCPAGSARLVRRVRDASEAALARAFFARQGVAAVRVSPFVEGIPWGVNGLVFPDGVAVGPVVEMITLRDGPRFCTVGTATFWQPAPSDEQAIRALARAVGEVLGEGLGYRGGFTVDGVLGTCGPVPTEVNARTGGARFQQEEHEPDLCIGWMSRLLREGNEAVVSARSYEALWTSSMRGVGGGYGGLAVEAPWEGDRKWSARWVQGRLVLEETSPEVALWAHAMQPQGFFRVVPEPARTPLGPSIAPVVRAGLALGAETLDFPLPDWQPARDVRR